MEPPLALGLARGEEVSRDGRFRRLELLLLGVEQWRERERRRGDGREEVEGEGLRTKRRRVQERVWLAIWDQQM